MGRASKSVAAGLSFAALSALAQPTPAPVADCKALGAEAARAEDARRAAQEDSDNAWKAVVPFVVLARKASAKAALDEAQKKLGELKPQLAACEDARTR